MERGKRWELEQIESNKKYNMKLESLPVDPHKLYCMPVMFNCFVYALMMFCAHEFPGNPETLEPEKYLLQLVCKCFPHMSKLRFTKTMNLCTAFWLVGGVIYCFDIY